MNIFEKEAQVAVERNYNFYKIEYADRLTNREELYKMIDIVKYTLEDELANIFRPIGADGQADKELKEKYKDTDFKKLFESYCELFIQLCKDYLKQIGKSVD